MIPQNAEHQEAEQVAHWKAVADDLDLTFELLLDDDPSHTMCVITGPAYMMDTIMSRRPGQRWSEQGEEEDEP